MATDCWTSIFGGPQFENFPDLRLQGFRKILYPSQLFRINSRYQKIILNQSLHVIFFNFQVCWFKGCSLINAIVSCSIVMLYIMAALFLFQAGSEHYDAEMAMVTMILILGVIEAVTAITVLGISCSSDPPRQVKRNVFINVLSKQYFRSYSTRENVYFYLLVYSLPKQYFYHSLLRSKSVNSGYYCYVITQGPGGFHAASPLLLSGWATRRLTLKRFLYLFRELMIVRNFNARIAQNSATYPGLSFGRWC